MLQIITSIACCASSTRHHDPTDHHLIHIRHRHRNPQIHGLKGANAKTQILLDRLVALFESPAFEKSLSITDDSRKKGKGRARAAGTDIVVGGVAVEDSRNPPAGTLPEDGVGTGAESGSEDGIVNRMSVHSYSGESALGLGLTRF